ncbi:MULTISPECIES: ABC transporter permease [unclassified Lysinibacillus]|uniref:ABC transporter permease n=1 Tax=unclassified Lysinibacillus TaxID=2636778 RepID=UPI002557146E|nr:MULTISPECIES: ABC transporter permease [unclassified Lysinibacillus]MDM5250917.1 ABC transporter permease [Lysinibacillus sp. G4S2]
MITTLVLNEYMKLRRQWLWAVLIIVPLVSCLLGYNNFFTYQDILVQKDDNEWTEAWTQASLFYGMIMLPILSGFYCSISCRNENSGGGWKQMLALPPSRIMIYIAKMILILILVFVTQLVLVSEFIITGLILGLHDSIPWFFLFKVLVLGFLAVCALVAIQLWMASQIKSFVTPISINVALTLLAFVTVGSELGNFYPWAQPTLAMSSPDEVGIHSVLFFLSINLVTFSVATVLGIVTFDKKDIY